MLKDEALIQLGSRRKQEALAAAQYLLSHLLVGDLQEGGGRVLPVVVELPERKVSGEELTVRIGQGEAALSAHITLDAVRKSASSEAALSYLVFGGAGLLRQEDTPGSASTPIPADESTYGKTPVSAHESVVITRRTTDVLERIKSGVSVALIGNSSSGKTTTASQVANLLSLADWGVTWIDLSDSSADTLRFLLSLCHTSASRAGRHLIVIDDIQGNVSEARELSWAWGKIADLVSPPCQLLLLGWESVKKLCNELFPDTITVSCQGDHLIPELIDNLTPGLLSDNAIAEIRNRTGGDLLVTRLILNYARLNGSIPSLSELAADAYAEADGPKTLDRDTASLLYHLAALSQFEIDASRSYAEHISAAALSELIELKTIRVNRDYLSLGHRSLAQLVLEHLKRNFAEELVDVPLPSRVAVDYLRGAESRIIIKTLERLDIANLGRNRNDQYGTAFLADAWASLQVLIAYLANQSSKDPSWGDNISSAIFAAKAFAEVGHEAETLSARYIRSRWIIPDNGELPKPDGKSTNEYYDFDEIRKCMAEEDQFFVEEREDLSVNIDNDLFHRQWVLGLLLVFEGATRTPNIRNIGRLIQAAQSNQSPQGSFYPARVPWLTARVIIGLTSVGETVRSSDTVRRGCDWLRTPYPEGPYKLGAWESGTGTWNSTLMTTAMCVAALVSAGVPTYDPTIQAGVSFLIEHRDEWVAPGREIDGALAMKAVLQVRRRWREIKNELSNLLSWAKEREAWAKADQLASDSHTESSKILFVTNSLVEIVWTTVTAELPLLFEDIATTFNTVGSTEISLSGTFPTDVRGENSEIKFDVFLAHNGQDKSNVEAIAESLKKRGIKPWLDKWNIQPGRRFAKEIERVLPQVKAVAVLVGDNGIGPWEDMEIYSALELCASTNRPLIPVLLPGTEKEPELPLFLRQFSWVRFTKGIQDEEALDDLEWGITGRHPKRTES